MILDTLLPLSYLDATSAAEIQRQKDIAMVRNYHSGAQGVKLTSRLQEFLGTSVAFRMNIVKSVVTAISERLNITGLDSSEPGLMTWAWNVWTRNELTAYQEDIYEGALRDGEYFVIVSWEDGRPIVVPHQRYVDVAYGGDSYGCWMKYVSNDPRQPVEYGVKQWTKVDGVTQYQRRNVYYPDRIEKLVRNSSGEWVPWSEEPVVPWVDGQGNPLGVAVIPFNNKGLTCEAWDALPLQNAANKSLVDLLVAADQTAFRIYYALGFIPTTDGKPIASDGSNQLTVEPGRVVGTSKSSRETDFGAIDPADLRSLMDLTHQVVLWTAMVTNTPVSRFISTKLIASDATLKEQEGPLRSRTRSRQSRFATSWKKVFDLARNLENTFGTETVPDGDLVMVWGEPASRSEAEKLEILQQKQDIGVPRKQLWVEAGYTRKTIETFEEETQDDGQS